MFKYFKELLSVLKKIEVHLDLLSYCVKKDHHQHGDKISISTKHWND